MRVQLDAHVRTSDGHRAGTVKRVIFDPKRNEVTAFVVGTGGLLGHDVVVSPDVLERGAREDEITLELSKAELDGLERYDDAGYAPPPYGWLAPASYTFPTASYLFPLEPGLPLATPGPAERRERRPVITEGMRVKDHSGAAIGTVREVRVDDMTGELRSIVVHGGGAGDDEVTEFTADQIDIGDGEIHVGAPAGRTHAAKSEGA